MLIAQKYFDFSASHRLARWDWSAEKNRSFFGLESQGAFGHGHNYRLGVGISGPVAPNSGMICELSELKELLLSTVMPQFDHVYLNAQPAFTHCVPTVEAVVDAIFKASEAQLAAPLVLEQCTLTESPAGDAVRYRNGELESAITLQLLEIPQRIWHRGEIREIIHPLIMRVTFGYQLDPDCHHCQAEQLMKLRFSQWAEAFQSPRALTLAQYALLFWPLLQVLGPVKRIRLLSLGAQGCSYAGEEWIDASVHTTHFWGHHLENPDLSNAQNLALFGRCFAHHGHTFDLDTTIRMSAFEDQLISPQILKVVEAVTQGWNYRSITSELTTFMGKPGTCETVISELAQQLAPEIPVIRLSLFETPNNQFIWQCNRI